jgi:hypothetical protein
MVAITVNRYLVSAGDDLSQSARSTFYLLPNDEERGLRLGLLQQAKEGVQPAVWAIIEGQRHGVSCFKPCNLGEKQTLVPNGWRGVSSEKSRRGKGQGSSNPGQLTDP